MDPDMEEHYKELLKEWKKDEDHIKDKLEEMEDKIRDDLEPMKSELKSEIVGIRETLDTMKATSTESY